MEKMNVRYVDLFKDEKERLSKKGDFGNESKRQYKNLDALDSLNKIQLKDNDYKYRENPENSYDP